MTLIAWVLTHEIVHQKDLTDNFKRFHALYDDVWVSDTCHEWLIIETLKTNTWIFTHMTTGRIVMMEGGNRIMFYLSMLEMIDKAVLRSLDITWKKRIPKRKKRWPPDQYRDCPWRQCIWSACVRVFIECGISTGFWNTKDGGRWVWEMIQQNKLRV